jgi:hypothetical protein
MSCSPVGGAHVVKGQIVMRVIFVCALLGVIATPALAQTARARTAPLPQPGVETTSSSPQEAATRPVATPAAAASRTSVVAPVADQRTAAAGSNIRLDLTITDTYTGTPSTKTVTILIASGANARVRTANVLPNGYEVELNVDAGVSAMPGSDVIRTDVTFEYSPAQVELGGETPATRADMPIRPAQLHESLTVFLNDGQQTMVSQSADPATDRKVTVELTATIVR